MNDLEFIEIEMECCEIDFVLAQKREDKILIRHFKERYEQLKQIKAKIEAWEELKPEIKEHKEVLYEDELINVLVFALPYSANPKKYNAIKKAMEVSDES